MPLRTVLLACLCLAGPDASARQNEMYPGQSHASQPVPVIDASDPAAIVELMHTAGFQAELQLQENGAAQIQSSVGGTNFWLYFQACEEDFTGCEIITLSSGFDFDTPQVRDILGDWNETRYSKAYLDSSGDPFIEFSINMLYGVSEENFINTLTWFTTEMSVFMDQVGWRSGQGRSAQPI